MDVTIQLSTSAGLGSRLIRWLTWSEYSHVDIVGPDGQLLGARFKGGVKIRPINYAKFTKIKRFVIKDVNATEFFTAAFRQIGKPYDWRAILNFGLRRRNLRETDSWFCSEYVAWVFEQAGKPLANPNVDVRRVTPRDLTLSTELKEAPSGTVS